MLADPGREVDIGDGAPQQRGGHDQGLVGRFAAELRSNALEVVNLHRHQRTGVLERAAAHE
ncbi:hypothetical protein D3C84_1264060 [compost metagenome]